MSAPLAYWNGTFRPQSEVTIPLHDAGFVYGATVTDLCRTFHHKLFRWGDHLRRFRRSCELAQVPLRASDADLMHVAHHLAEHNAALLAPGEDLALVFLATPGVIGFYLGEPGGPGDGEPHLILHTFPLPVARYARLYREGAVLVTPAVRHMPEACVPRQVKHRSRLVWWLAEREAKRAHEHANALLLDADGCITETASANFLLVRAGEALSPPRSRILHGVSLDIVQELCQHDGIPFREAELRTSDVDQADEAFLTCTSFCMAPVRRVNEREFPCPGPVYRRLAAAWQHQVGVPFTG
jgi:branched-chain amino acid aminotransferase